jgi:AbiU2
VRTRLEPDKRIPEPLREIYAHLGGAAIELHGALDGLRFLYGSEDTVKLLNDTAPAFFVRHQRLLIEDLIMSFCRLTDEPKTGRRENRQHNLTLSRLVNGLDDNAKELRKDLNQKLTRIRQHATPMRNYRHKLVAHADLAEYLAPSTNLGANISIDSMEELLREVDEFLVAFEYAFTGVEGNYYHPAEYGDVQELVAHLRLALEAERQTALMRDIQ